MVIYDIEIFYIVATLSQNTCMTSKANLVKVWMDSLRRMTSPPSTAHQCKEYNIDAPNP